MPLDQEAGGTIPLQVKHFMWKCLVWTRSTSPLHGSPHLWQWMTGFSDGWWGSWGCATGKNQQETHVSRKHSYKRRQLRAYINIRIIMLPNEPHVDSRRMNWAPSLCHNHEDTLKNKRVVALTVQGGNTWLVPLGTSNPLSSSQTSVGLHNWAIKYMILYGLIFCNMYLSYVFILV